MRSRSLSCSLLQQRGGHSGQTAQVQHATRCHERGLRRFDNAQRHPVDADVAILFAVCAGSVLATAARASLPAEGMARGLPPPCVGLVVQSGSARARARVVAATLSIYDRRYEYRAGIQGMNDATFDTCQRSIHRDATAVVVS